MGREFGICISYFIAEMIGAGFSVNLAEDKRFFCNTMEDEQ